MLQKFEDKLAKATEVLAEEEAGRMAVELKNKKLQKERENVQKQLDDLRALGSDFGDKIQRLQQAKQELDNQVNVSVCKAIWRNFTYNIFNKFVKNPHRT